MNNLIANIIQNLSYLAPWINPARRHWRCRWTGARCSRTADRWPRFNYSKHREKFSISGTCLFSRPIVSTKVLISVKPVSTAFDSAAAIIKKEKRNWAGNFSFKKNHGTMAALWSAVRIHLSFLLCVYCVTHLGLSEENQVTFLNNDHGKGASLNYFKVS